MITILIISIIWNFSVCYYMIQDNSMVSSRTQGFIDFLILPIVVVWDVIAFIMEKYDL